MVYHDGSKARCVYIRYHMMSRINHIREVCAQSYTYNNLYHDPIRVAVEHGIEAVWACSHMHVPWH